MIKRTHYTNYLGKEKTIGFRTNLRLYLSPNSNEIPKAVFPGIESYTTITDKFMYEHDPQ